MTYKTLVFYLKANLKKPSIDFEWTDEDNRSFFNFLEEEAPAYYLRKQENILTIQKAFKTYFESVGYIVFDIKNNKVKLKVIPYELEPEESDNIDDIIDIIDECEEFIVEEYNGKSDQILLEKELRDRIYEYVETIDDHKTNKKELVKFAVRESFELKESDIVLVKKESIFIKLCDISKRNKVKSSQKNTIADRYNGIDEEELRVFVEEHLSSASDRDFFNLVARLFVDRYLLENKISNEEYEKNVFSYIQLIITEQLINSFDKCESFFKGLSGYILRIHFIEVFENITEVILVEFSLSNSYIIDFLKYYSLDIIVIDGKKYKIKAIEAENGLKWNVVSMMSIVKIYVKTNSDGKFLRHAMEKKEEEMRELTIDGYTPVEYSKLYNVEKNLLSDELLNFEHELSILNDSKTLAKSESESSKLQDEIDVIKKDIEQIKKDQQSLKNRSVSLTDINRYLTLEKDINTMNKQLKKEEKLLVQNEESFNSIKNGLIRALISKKQQIV